MLQSGGVQVFVIPEELRDLSKLNIKVKVKKDDWKSESSFMVEPDWNLVLDENQKAIKRGSHQQSTVNARIYLRNQLAKQGMLKGNLPWDRYYGNLVSIKVGARINPVAQIDILVRVLHAVKLNQIPKNKISFKRDILPLFSYYLRYYPWLHITIENCQYTQFLDITDSSAVKGIISEMSVRLEKDDDDWQKMPRSRDFPVDGDKLIKRLEKEDMLV